jgi:hypothetical protein
LPIYTDQFYVVDPANPPGAGSTLSMVRLELNDVNSNGLIRAGNNDTVGGLIVNAVWQNDTITVTMAGVTRTITGVTFYRNGGPAVFTPTDGTVLATATFVRSTFVTTSTQVTVGNLGPACFLRGTWLDTPQGPCRIDTIRAGDLVCTRDNGPRPVLWLGHSPVDGMGEYAPIRFEMGSIGNDRPLLVSPLHRILIADWRAPYYFGMDEVFVHAKHLVNGRSIRRVLRNRAEYFHVMFDRHEIVQAHGAASESFFPGDTILHANAELLAQIALIVPQVAQGTAMWPLARPMLRAHEAALLRRSAEGNMPPRQLDARPAMGENPRHGQSSAQTAHIIPFAPRRRAA